MQKEKRCYFEFKKVPFIEKKVSFWIKKGIILNKTGQVSFRDKTYHFCWFKLQKVPFLNKATFFPFKKKKGILLDLKRYLLSRKKVLRGDQAFFFVTWFHCFFDFFWWLHEYFCKTSWNQGGLSAKIHLL